MMMILMGCNSEPELVSSVLVSEQLADKIFYAPVPWSNQTTCYYEFFRGSELIRRRCVVDGVCISEWVTIASSDREALQFASPAIEVSETARRFVYTINDRIYYIEVKDNNANRVEVSQESLILSQLTEEEEVFYTYADSDYISCL